MPINPYQPPKGEKIFEELRGLNWPEAFVVEYADGQTETLMRGEGVCFAHPSDDPDGIGGFSSGLPKKHARNQKRLLRYVRFSELRAIYATDGTRLWP